MGFIGRAGFIGGAGFGIKSCLGLSGRGGEDDHSTGEEGIAERTHDGMEKELAWEVDKTRGTKVNKEGFC